MTQNTYYFTQIGYNYTHTHMHALIHLLMVMDVLRIKKRKMTMLQEKIMCLVGNLTHAQEK